MSDKSGSDDDQKVGYGQPPKSTQFKPGQCGNPKGRPKGSKNKLPPRKFLTQHLEEIVALGDESITARIDGKQKKISRREAIYRSIINNGVKGGVQAQRLASKILTDASSQLEAQRLKEIELIERFIAYYTPLFEERDRDIEAGLPVGSPPALIDPRNITINYDELTFECVETVNFTPEEMESNDFLICACLQRKKSIKLWQGRLASAASPEDEAEAREELERHKGMLEVIPTFFRECADYYMLSEDWMSVIYVGPEEWVE